MSAVLDHPTRRSPPRDRAEAGKAARERVPLEAHGEWAPPEGRADPVELLQTQAVSRVPELVPIRYGRMSASPFAFYRGAALVMANDLAGTPVSGFTVQVCGDAHASNFGIFGTPERGLLFDVNDFDETLPGPWEWDVKRLAASLAIAGREVHFDRQARESIVAACARSYRTAMKDFAAMHNLDVWYARLDTTVIQRWRSQLGPKQVKKAAKVAAKARAKDSARGLSKLTTEEGGELRFLSQPPLLVPLTELLPARQRSEVTSFVQLLLDQYAQTLRPELRDLLAGFRVVDMARKVVGVGSVGTRAWVILLLGRDGRDPLILQAKEAQASVLEAFVGASRFDNHGERVVVGQRSMQAASDIFLGWVRAKGIDDLERDFYVRQLWDWKGSVELDSGVPSGLSVYGELCGWTLARAHARTGDPIAISAYLGSADAFDRAVARFAETYADLNESDHRRLAAAVQSGDVVAEAGV
ncbi:DUF2252 domain-containing protein [Acidimicrobiaceae bacterium USS-CC1]|uniref:DUF2252 domain-containing protein n=1 Tax=Acidiferrimicrobium australe TaxID=2664430 RepID=A0ABW9QQ27_9ACTN|nr:DUF2252 domain-containing protein [Acidiferrimicrobium australe]